MKRDVIDGTEVVYEFKVFHHEWECDGYGWITADGRIWLTSHGSLYEGDVSEIKGMIGELTVSISGMNEAIRLHKTIVDEKENQNVSKDNMDSQVIRDLDLGISNTKGC